MVFHVKNLHTHKKIVPKTVAFLMIILTLSVLLAQMSLVSAQDGEASLTGSISDMGVDTTAAGFYETLDIGVEVNVTVAGTFKVKVSGLLDKSDELVDVSNQNITYLDVGVQTVYVSLDGSAIYESWLNPTNVSSIILYNESGDILDSLSGVSLSTFYAFADFGILPATLTGTITDEGVDTNDDGLYDYLRIGVEVNVTDPGTYTVDLGGLYDSVPNILTGAYVNSTHLDAGIHMVYVDMYGPDIYAATVNPTTLGEILLYQESEDKAFSTLNDVTLPTSYTFDEFQRPNIVIEFTEIDREIMLDQAGNIYVTNTYQIKNVGYWINNIQIGFPEDAYDLSVRDEMGDLKMSTYNNVLNVTLRTTVDTNETIRLHVDYWIPWSSHVTQSNGVDYNLQFTFYEQFNSTIGQLNVDILLPKGAKFQSSTPLDPASVKENSLRDTMTFSFSDVTPSDDLNFEIDYKYDVFWSSFYPTIWMGLIAVAAAVFILLLGTPKTISVPTIKVPSKELKSFIEAHEEKATIQSDLESLDDRLRKGKIPRRRYKVRKKMLDSRLSTVCRNISALSDELRSAGSKYANMMRQIEVAEAKLEGAKRDMTRIKKRYRRGEVSKDAYGKLLEDYKSRIEDAEATIDGVLLRLRE
jgi:hypothetical protein